MKDKHKVDLQGIVVDSVLVEERSSSLEKLEVMEDFPGSKKVEEGKREGKVDKTIKMPEVMTMEDKE